MPETTLTKGEQESVLKKGYATTLEGWWFLVDDKWGDLKNFFHSMGTERIVNADKAYKDRDAEALWHHFQKAWEHLPDRPQIHSIPGFYRLCNLCSGFPHEDHGSDVEGDDGDSAIQA